MIVLSNAVSAGDIYQCTDENGNKTFTDRPCQSQVHTQNQDQAVVELDNRMTQQPSGTGTETFTATDAEEAAIKEAMAPMMEYTVAVLEDLSLIDDGKPLMTHGCLVSMSETVPVDTVRYYSNVAMKCVVVDPDDPIEHQAHIFIPVRLADLCEGVGKNMSTCDVR